MLVKIARDAKLVDDDVYGATLAASLFTILLNAILMRVVPDMMDRMAREAPVDP